MEMQSNVRFPSKPAMITENTFLDFIEETQYST